MPGVGLGGGGEPCSAVGEAELGRGGDSVCMGQGWGPPVCMGQDWGSRYGQAPLPASWVRPTVPHASVEEQAWPAPNVPCWLGMAPQPAPVSMSGAGLHRAVMPGACSSFSASPPAQPIYKADLLPCSPVGAQDMEQPAPKAKTYGEMVAQHYIRFQDTNLVGAGAAWGGGGLTPPVSYGSPLETMREVPTAPCS